MNIAYEIGYRYIYKKKKSLNQILMHTITMKNFIIFNYRFLNLK